MTTINYTNGVLVVQIDYARREDIKGLPVKARAWDGDTKTWTVDRNLLGELLALFPDATMTADVQKLSEILILEQCQRWRDSGVTLLRDGDKLTALHNAAPSADIAALRNDRCNSAGHSPIAGRRADCSRREEGSAPNA
ncbi:MAG: hypothetical protein IPJ48_15145 [Propionivibrio sp.]|uniref:Uncharacterized protein n=1 Tax=Candidatus Propionivibrio dominans TaxID=2954373 RepID=A0A9D7F8V4_9RHOO|nr:hypothetical protein [Candidatus Propionivibrio dominans]